MKSLHDINSWATTDATTNFNAAWSALGTAGLIASIDETLIWLLAERLAQYASLRSEAEGKPTLVPLGSGSLAVNPLIKLRDETSKDCARLLRAVGMTPLSRRGLSKVRDVVRPGDMDHFMKCPPLPSNYKPAWQRRLDGDDDAPATAPAAGLWADLKPDDYEGDFAT
jgi:hypothetical protein